MNRFQLLLALLAVSFSVQAAHHQKSTFQNTCSNIKFVYQGNDAALKAVCLKANGTPNKSVMVLNGIGNDDGKLVSTDGASTFQQSCGNIQIVVDGPDVTLYAQCRRMNGEFLETGMPLYHIGNINGELKYE